MAEQLGLAGNTLTAGAGAVADVARVTAAAGSVVELDINQTTNAWNTAGQGQALAYHEGGQLAGLVEGMREGDIEDGFVLQDGLAEVDQFLNQTDDERVRVTEGATNSNGNAVYGAAHQDSNTLFVDIDGERIGSLVNTVAHEGMHLNGAGEINATVTGYMTDLAYRANAYANRDAIDSHRPAPVAIQNPAAHQQLLSGNQALFAELEQRDDLEFRQLNATEIDLVQLNTETYARQQGYCQDTQCSPEALQQAGTELRLEALRRVDATYAEHGEENPNAGEFLNELGAGSAIDGSDQLLFAEDRHYSDSYVSQEHMADAELIAYVLRADDVPEDMKTAVLQSILASTGSGWGQEQLVELFTDSDLKAQVTDTLPLSGFGGQEPLLYSTIVAEAIAGDITRLNDQIAVLQDNLADSNHRGTELGLMEEGQLWNLMAARNMLQQEGGAEPATELMGTMFNHEALGGGSMLLFLGEELADRSRLASLGPQLRGDGGHSGTGEIPSENNSRDFSGGRPSLQGDAYSPEIVNTRSAEFYNLYGDNPLRGSMSNAEARQWYLAADRGIVDRIDLSAPLDVQAKQAFDLRNSNRTEARELMADRIEADRLYREEPNLTWDQMIQRQQSRGLSGDDIYNSILQSSQRTRTEINQRYGLE
ncbi:hypothetical protein E4656_10430 [Natronospirillum operosum]|uniref:Uncharacterized protein n=1 Tax=Natronospirillum operosum TaxID=2759953 RepID=A0A4Z0WAR4_9GAMM|nr:hypothetical protein [Natronospirillum operosum]TGG93455.1 hypothetical protein E4656_10430 [Natronospirillum operosum]